MGASMTVMNIVEAYDSHQLDALDKNLSMGCDLFLSDADAKEKFIDFVKKDTWKDMLLAKDACDRILKENLDGMTDISSDIYSQFILSSKPTPLAQTFSKENHRAWEQRPTDYIDDTKKKLRTILLATIFPLFLKSAQYKAYLEMKSYDSEVVTDLPPDRNFDDSTAEERLDSMLSMTPSLNTKAVLSDATASIDVVELKHLLSSGHWIRNVLGTVEDLRLCVSIATARAERPGFPLIYVNKAFEQTTGYPRSEIVGQNCRFLQSKNTEEDQIQLLVTALAKAQPVKVVLTNRRKDGTG